MYYYVLFFCCFLFSLFLWFLWVYKSFKAVSAPKPKFVHGEDEDEGVSSKRRRMSIEYSKHGLEYSKMGRSPLQDLVWSQAGGAIPPDFKNVSIYNNEFEGKLIIRHKTEIGEGKRISEIPKEEAICEICSVLFKEDNSALMTACGCDKFLVHENCKLKTLTSRTSEKCYSCHQVFKDTAVALSRSRSINLQKESSPKRYGGRISNMFKWSKRV